MAFAVTVDGRTLARHQDEVADAVGRAAGAPIVPVIKGNGYGLGQRTLVGEALRLQADTVAVGTVAEVPEVAAQGSFDIVVLEPFDPRDTLAAELWWAVAQDLNAGRVIRTVASHEALLALADGPGSVRVVLEAQTSMHRFGFDEPDLVRTLADPLVRRGVRPRARPRRGSRPAPADRPAGGRGGARR